jgi:hypothetical protein
LPRQRVPTVGANPATSAERHVVEPRSAYRYLHSLFAYATDLVPTNWATNELARLEKAMAGTTAPAIDLIYVLKRGLIDVRFRTFIPENEETGQALVAYFFAIYNFMDRENRRRERAPSFNYASDLNKFWQKIR